MKNTPWIYCNQKDPRIFVYENEENPFWGAILNFGHRKSLWIMVFFIASLLLPEAGIFLLLPASSYLAVLWGILWAVMVLWICLAGAKKDICRYPGKRSFRE